jgi:hypothetical protein
MVQLPPLPEIPDSGLPEAPHGGELPAPHFTGIAIATMKAGKTTTCARLIKAYPRGYWTHVYVISPTAKNQRALWSYMEVPDEHVYIAASLKELKEAMIDLLTEVKGAMDAHKSDLAYKAVYQKHRRGSALTTSEERLLESRDGEPPGAITPRPVAFVLIDDMAGLRAVDAHSWTSTVVRHRHLAGGAGISIMHCVQMLKSSVSRAVRQCSSLFMLWGTHDMNQVHELALECAGHISKAKFLELFHDATSRSRHDFLAINLAAPKGRIFSRNFEHFYNV